MKSNILQSIASPDDLKLLSENELSILAEEIRKKLIETVSKTGGHLASNLGSVELTIAMHRVFNSPNDQFVFDVGHQCYTHKILTGRLEGFSTLRQKDGISGFTRPDESEHDIFYSGHSTTSLSQGLGLAQAKLMNSDESYVVCVIGDGSFTGGMAYEALNNAGKTNNRLIVILNDNKMSISENVGAFASYLAVIRSNPKYFRLKQKTEKTINKIPFIGEKISETIFEVKTDIKNRIYNQSTFFEDIGFRYMGPIDGHNIHQLILALEGAKMVNKPVVLHVSTTKGKGYDYAEKMPSEFHGISRFDIETGEPISSDISFSEIFGREICSIAKENNDLCCVTAAMSLGTGLEDFSREYPDRFFDVGIAEEHAVTFCSGLAKNGKIPVFAVYSTFLQRGYDQIIHDVALQKQKVIFAVDRAGFTGNDGETHQGLFDVSFFNSIPNITVYSPSSFSELRDCFHNSIDNALGCVAIRYPRGTEVKYALNEKENHCDYLLYNVSESTASIIVTYGRITANVLNAVKNNRTTAVLQLLKIKPLNPDCIQYAMGYSKVYFFEESYKIGGIGELFGFMLLEKGYKGKYMLKAVENEFVKQGTVEEQLKEYKLDTKSIEKIIGEE